MVWSLGLSIVACTAIQFMVGCDRVAAVGESPGQAPQPTGEEYAEVTCQTPNFISRKATSQPGEEEEIVYHDPPVVVLRIEGQFVTERSDLKKHLGRETWLYDFQVPNALAEKGWRLVNASETLISDGNEEYRRVTYWMRRAK